MTTSGLTSVVVLTTGGSAGGSTGFTTGGSTGGTTGGTADDTTGGTADDTTDDTAESAALQAWHLFCATEHVGQSENEPLVVAAPQPPHLPMFMICDLRTHFAHSPARAETGTSTSVTTSTRPVIQCEMHLLISHPICCLNQWLRSETVNHGLSNSPIVTRG
ncbi:MAG: hypothetical protein FJ222_09585 [Lentisphaerae bacterium]|nr:hypothetical protein [Lentisphaerota bacterium]